MPIEANTIYGSELEAYGKYLIGKPCPLHPQSKIKDGKWDIWCGNKTELGTWCNGGSVNKEWLENYRKIKA